MTPVYLHDQEANTPQSVRNLTAEQRQELVGLRSRAEQRLRKRQINKRLQTALRQLFCLQMSKVFLVAVLKGYTSLVARKNSRFRTQLTRIYRNYRLESMLCSPVEQEYRKTVVKQRIIDGEDSDKIVQDLRRFLSFAQNDIPAGYRMFVSPEEAMNLAIKNGNTRG